MLAPALYSLLYLIPLPMKDRKKISPPIGKKIKWTIQAPIFDPSIKGRQELRSIYHWFFEINASRTFIQGLASVMSNATYNTSLYNSGMDNAIRPCNWGRLGPGDPHCFPLNEKYSRNLTKFLRVYWDTLLVSMVVYNVLSVRYRYKVAW